MISESAITAWRRYAPWGLSEQIEHDLVLSRAICSLYQHPHIQEHLIFRGGTALHKLFFPQAGRYSEDLDFVQTHAMPIGETVNAIRDCLDDWLGKPSWKQSSGRFTLNYYFMTEIQPIVKHKVKIEINTREHFNSLPLIQKSHAVDNSWYSGQADILTYSLEELMGTKLRALYQRKKGRDLFDFWFAQAKLGKLDYDAIINVFNDYMRQTASPITRAQFEQNLFLKQKSKVFLNDIYALLPAETHDSYDIEQAFGIINQHLIPRLKGEPWKGNSQ